MHETIKKALGFAAAAAVGLTAMALVPVSNAANSSADSAPPRCASGPGIETRVLDQNTILAHNGSRGNVLINVTGCRPDRTDVLVIEYFGSSQICSASDIDLSVKSTMSSIPIPCFIQSVTPISKEEAKALQKQPYKRADRG